MVNEYICPALLSSCSHVQRVLCKCGVCHILPLFIFSVTAKHMKNTLTLMYLRVKNDVNVPLIWTLDRIWSGDRYDSKTFSVSLQERRDWCWLTKDNNNAPNLLMY